MLNVISIFRNIHQYILGKFYLCIHFGSFRYIIHIWKDQQNATNIFDHLEVLF